MRVIACLVLAACAAPAGTVTQAVTNGSDDAGDPAVVALVDDQGNVGCTASVIEAHTVVTAAHCLGAVEPLGIGRDLPRRQGLPRVSLEVGPSRPRHLTDPTPARA